MILKLSIAIGFVVGVLASFLSPLMAGVAGILLIVPIAPRSWGMLGWALAGGVEYAALGLAIGFVIQLAVHSGGMSDDAPS